MKRLLARARAVCGAGGDWEHKNRLKVYEGVFAMYSRDFKRAAALFLDSIATFTTWGGAFRFCVLVLGSGLGVEPLFGRRCS